MSARQFLDFVGLQGHEEEIANSIPYGNQRRLEIARALATGPQDRSIDRLHAEIQDVMNNLGDLVGVRSPGSRSGASG